MENIELSRVVEDLKRQRIIFKNKDIADKLGMSESTISEYVTGKVKASEKFITKFEKVFNVKVFPNLEKRITSEVKSNIEHAPTTIDALYSMFFTAEW